MDLIGMGGEGLVTIGWGIMSILCLNLFGRQSLRKTHLTCSGCCQDHGEDICCDCASQRKIDNSRRSTSTDSDFPLPIPETIFNKSKITEKAVGPSARNGKVPDQGGKIKRKAASLTFPELQPSDDRDSDLIAGIESPYINTTTYKPLDVTPTKTLEGGKTQGSRVVNEPSQLPNDRRKNLIEHEEGSKPPGISSEVLSPYSKWPEKRRSGQKVDTLRDTIYPTTFNRGAEITGNQRPSRKQPTSSNMRPSMDLFPSDGKNPINYIADSSRKGGSPTIQPLYSDGIIDECSNLSQFSKNPENPSTKSHGVDKRERKSFNEGPSTWNSSRKGSRNAKEGGFPSKERYSVPEGSKKEPSRRTQSRSTPIEALNQDPSRKRSTSRSKAFPQENGIFIETSSPDRSKTSEVGSPIESLVWEDPNRRQFRNAKDIVSSRKSGPLASNFKQKDISFLDPPRKKTTSESRPLGRPQPSWKGSTNSPRKDSLDDNDNQKDTLSTDPSREPMKSDVARARKARESSSPSINGSLVSKGSEKEFSSELRRLDGSKRNNQLPEIANDLPRELLMKPKSPIEIHDEIDPSLKLPRSSRGKRCSCDYNRVHEQLAPPIGDVQICGDPLDTRGKEIVHRGIKSTGSIGECPAQAKPTVPDEPYHSTLYKPKQPNVTTSKPLPYTTANNWELPQENEICQIKVATCVCPKKSPIRNGTGREIQTTVVRSKQMHTGDSEKRLQEEGSTIYRYTTEYREYRHLNRQKKNRDDSLNS